MNIFPLRPTSVLISCEHASNAIPEKYVSLVEDKKKLLHSHEGWDIGAQELAGLIAARVRAPLLSGTINRLLVDLNRSTTNHRSHPLRHIPACPTKIKKELLERFYFPYRHRIESTLVAMIKETQPVLHLSVHSFTPVLKGQKRNADIGFLYDPQRPLEREFCRCWQINLNKKNFGLRTRKNYPYRGTSDGLVTFLRRKYPARDYIGIELEVNQEYPLENKRKWLLLCEAIADSFEELLELNSERMK